MIGDTVKQTRCTTCDADHEYKHAAMPRPRKKPEQSALYSQVLANVTPKRVTPMPHVAEPEAPVVPVTAPVVIAPPVAAPLSASPRSATAAFDALFDLPAGEESGAADHDAEEAPAHRRLIRAQLPKHEGQVATTRQMPDFTIRQPNPGRPKRFGARPGRAAGPQSFGGNGNRQGSGLSNHAGRGGNTQRQGGRPQGGGQRQGNNRQGGGRNRSK
jgi:hypothetical protein